MVDLDPFFAEVMPYISNFAKIKKLLIELQSQMEDLSELQSALEAELAAQEPGETTMQTDLRIIIQFLEKRK
ncbi:MAG: hypothetical protein ACFFB3_09100 [Candidatus Hodarchaeota archaeon]